MVIGGDIANTGNSNNYMRPGLVGGPKLSNPTTGRWIRASLVNATDRNHRNLA